MVRDGVDLVGQPEQKRPVNPVDRGIVGNVFV
jgi:hypothetical protein